MDATQRGTPEAPAGPPGRGGQGGAGLLENEAAAAFVTGLRTAPPPAVGDLISGALREVAQAEQPLAPGPVQAALAAVALLVAGVAHHRGDPEAAAAVLAPAVTAAELASWFADLQVELNPARLLIAGQAVDRLLLPQDNSWLQADRQEPDLERVRRLRDQLTDAAPD